MSKPRLNRARKFFQAIDALSSTSASSLMCSAQVFHECVGDLGWSSGQGDGVVEDELLEIGVHLAFPIARQAHELLIT